ncbi:MAG: hypothetical protein JWO67_1458 [Streptosporangiaceae bacterium]|nr:hypothetical protein [Streptosporangiaceae bacterium]
MTNTLDQLGKLWADHQAAIVLGVGAVIVVLLAVVGWRFYRSGAKSKWVGGVAAVTVLAWTSEGLWQVARNRMHLPLAFAIMTFFVFEAMMIAAGMRAEEHRAAKGVPGPAGRYVWILATCSGFISSLGALVIVEYPLRVILPLLAVGLWWVGITAERDTDTDEMKAERQRLADEREATWTVTPRTILVRLGVMKPGKSSTTEAQREHQIARMVMAADTIAIGGRGAKRARKRLRRLARTADAAMIETVAERVRQAVDAERLMVPVAAGQVDRADGGPAQRTDAGQIAALPAPVPAVRTGEPAPTVATLPGPRGADEDAGDPFADVRDQVAQALRTGRTDDELLAEYGSKLAGVFRSTGKISRYRVERACGIGGRQADRIKAAIEGGWQPPVNGAAVRELVNR